MSDVDDGMKILQQRVAGEVKTIGIATNLCYNWYGAEVAWGKLQSLRVAGDRLRLLLEVLDGDGDHVTGLKDNWGRTLFAKL